MSLISKIFQRSEKYDPIHPKDPGLARLFQGMFANTAAGISVTPNNAMCITGVYAAVSIIAESIAMLPWYVNRTTGDGGKEKLTGDPRYRLLNSKPNRFQNTIEYREMILTSYLLRGRSVSEKVMNNRGIITDIIPLHPDDIKPFKAPDGRIAYEHTVSDNRRILLSEEVIDIRGISTNGVDCISPIEANQEALAIAKASELYAGKYFGNGTVVSGVLETESHLNDTTYKRLKEWTERHQGVGRSHNPAILEGGLKWKPISVSPNDAQLLETRSYSIEEVARIYRIPAYKLGRMDSVKFNTTEQQAIDFVTDTLLPRVRKLELAHDLGLFNESEQRSISTEISLKEILRADSKTRSESNRKMFDMGSITPNEIRAGEGLNPYDGGDRYYIAVNMTPVGLVGVTQKETVRSLIRPIFERCERAEQNALDRGKDMVTFYQKHKDFVTQCSQPLFDIIGDEARRFIDDYYLERLQSFEQSGKIVQRSEVVTNSFITLMERLTCKQNREQ